MLVWCLLVVAAPVGADDTLAAGLESSIGRSGATTTIAGDMLRLGEIVSLRHPVTIHRGGGIGGTAPGADAHPVDALHNGDWIYDSDWIETGAGGHVEFVLGNQGRVRLGERTRIQLASECLEIGGRDEADRRTDAGRLIHGYLQQGSLRVRVRQNLVTPLQFRFHVHHGALTFSRGDLVLRGGQSRMDVCVRAGGAQLAYVVQEEGGMGAVQGVAVEAGHRLVVRFPIREGVLVQAVAVEEGCALKPELVFTLERQDAPEAVPIQRRPDLDGA